VKREVTMKAKKNPIEWRQLDIEEVEKYRHIDCDDYDDCLDLAIKEEWTGFNCLNCSQFESEVFVMLGEDIIEEIMDFLKEHELPQKSTVYDSASCGTLVKESVRGLFYTINDLKKEKKRTVKARRSIADRDLIYNRFLEEWNDQGIINHKKITIRMKKAIDKVMKDADYPLIEVFKAFENYAIILKSRDYAWSYKWTMADFLSRGLHKFVDEAQPLGNSMQDVKPKSNNPYANFSCGVD
jgi:hypothetical protein